MQSVSDDDVRKRFHEKPRFELAAKGAFRLGRCNIFWLWQGVPSPQALVHILRQNKVRSLTVRRVLVIVCRIYGARLIVVSLIYYWHETDPGPLASFSCFSACRKCNIVLRRCAVYGLISLRN